MDADTYTDLLPWLVFVVIDRKSGLGIDWASAGAAVTAGLLVVRAYWRGRQAPAPVVALIVFSVSCVVAIVSPAWDGAVSDPRAAVVLVLALVALASLGIRPMSEAYTGGSVAPGIRGSSAFHRVNVEITAAWAAGGILVAGTFAASSLDSSPVALTFLNWIIPLALLFATYLWVARRWERFRVSTAVGPGSERAAAWLVPGQRGQRDDAVIHRLPARGSGGA